MRGLTPTQGLRHHRHFTDFPRSQEARVRASIDARTALVCP